MERKCKIVVLQTRAKNEKPETIIIKTAASLGVIAFALSLAEVR